MTDTPADANPPIRWYISGPMAGYPEHNFPAFQHACDTLGRLGYRLTSPHMINHGDTTEWADFLRRDLRIMTADCSGIILLPGWPESRGARLELQTALGLGWPVLYFDGYAIHPMSRGGQITPAIDVAFIDLLRGWSLRTFGPAARTRGVVSHIRKELVEILAAPDDASEWADLLILALDGAWRAGHDPADIIAAVRAKHAANEGRDWPDWRTLSQDQAIEHIR